MGLINRLKALFNIGNNPYLTALFSGWNTQYGPYKPNKIEDAIDEYKNWVYICADKNATSVASVPLRLYAAKSSRNSTRAYRTKSVPDAQLKYMSNSPTTYNYIRKAVEVEEVLEHPYLELMRNVNPVENEFETKELLMLYLELTGNAYLLLANSKLGKPSQLWVLQSQHITIIPDKTEYIKYYVYKKDTPQETRFEPEEIIHFKYPNPKDILYGTSPLMAAADSIDINNYMKQFEAALFKNRAVPEHYIVGKNLSKTQRDQLEEQLQKYKGAARVGKTGVFSGEIDIKALNLTPKELNFLAGHKITRDEIAAIFGVPVSKLTTEDVNRANAEAGDYAYSKDTILPRCRRIEQKLNERLLPLWDTRLFCAFDNPVPKDKEFRLQERSSNISNGYTSINEERQRDGLQEVPWGNYPWLPMNLLPVGSNKPSNIQDEPEKAHTGHIHVKKNFINYP